MNIFLRLAIQSLSSGDLFDLQYNRPLTFGSAMI